MMFECTVIIAGGELEQSRHPAEDPVRNITGRGGVAAVDGARRPL